MNDNELLKLLQETPPEELTDVQIEQLRLRLPESVELRQELASRLRLESSLSASLSRFTLSPDELIAQLRPPTNARPSRRGPVAVIVLLMIVALVIGWFVGDEARRREQIAQNNGVNESTDPAANSDDNARNNIASDDPTKQANPMPVVDPTTPRPADPNPLQAAVETGSSNPPIIAVEAEKFTRGNVQIQSSGTGNDRVTYVYADKSGKVTNYAEYDINISQAGVYELRLHYVGTESSTLGVLVNGDKQTKEVVQKLPEKKTRSSPEWMSVGYFGLVQGKNVVRLEKTKGIFPKLDSLELEYASTVFDPANPEPVVQKPTTPPPWQAVLDAEKLPRFADICFEAFDIAKSLPTREEIMRWVEPVAGQPGKISDTRKPLGSITGFDGLVRLRAPLTEDTALRLSLEDFNRLQIHLFHGERGITLSYFEDENYRWGAYATQRKATASAPLSESLTLTATDDGRCRRSELRFGGPFEIRYRDGEVILSRGDIVLLRAPLEGPPEDVFLQGKASFYGIALVRTSDSPFSKPTPPAVAAQIDRPADQVWQEQLPEGAKLERLADGSVRLIANKTKARGFASFPLPAHGLHEIVVQLEDVSPGISLFLSGEKLAPKFSLRFASVDKHNAMMVEAFHGDNTKSSTSISYYPLTQRCYTLSGKTCWLKLVGGVGITRWWISADGEHWGEAGPSLPLYPESTHLGLHHISDMTDCRATIKSVTLRPLPALLELSDPKLYASALPLPKKDSLESWEADVSKAASKGATPADWRRACLLRTLAASCPQKIGLPLMTSLMDEIAAGTLPLEHKFRIFNECLTLMNVGDNQLPMAELARRFTDAGWYEFDRNGARPFSAVRRAMMSAPFGSAQFVAVGDPRLVRTELLQLLYGSEWSATLALCRQLRYYQQQEPVKLVDWAEIIARRELPVLEPGSTSNSGTVIKSRARRPLGRGDSLARQRANWSSPLIEELSKETYNTLAELQAVLDSKAYDDAARMVAGFDPNSVLGVAPIATDERLLVSLPAAIRLAIDTNPQLRNAIEERFGQLAQLRVRQAIAAGNAPAVELATVQFPTTEAVAEAHRWLGDRALSSGRFVQALAAYRQALATAGAALRTELQMRERFAAAMLGQDVGSPATQNVPLGERLLSAGEFESAIRDLRARANPASDSATITRISGPVPVAPRPTGFDEQQRAKMDGRVGDTPQEEVTRDLNKGQVDWPGRQIASVAEGETLFVSNRFQVAAYNLSKNGERIWQSKALPGKSRKARDWALVAMRPLVMPHYLVARQAVGEGLSLVCLDKKTGDQRWLFEPPKDSELASDPISAIDKLYVFTVTKPDAQGSILRLASLDPETGELLSQNDILRLGPVWHVRHCCEIAALDDAFVAALGGVLVCCDLNGNVRWIRKQVALPPDEEPDWIQQYFDPPLLHAHRLLVAQPGVRSLEYIDPVTGRLLWQSLILNIRRLLGVVGDNVIVMTDDGLEGHSLATGKRVWRHSATGLTTAQLCGGDGGVAYVKSQVGGDRAKSATLRMTWLDPRTGEATAATTLKKIDGSDLRFGPFANVQGRLWAFSGKGQFEPVRDFVELVPAGDAEKMSKGNK